MAVEQIREGTVSDSAGRYSAIQEFGERTRIEDTFDRSPKPITTS